MKNKPLSVIPTILSYILLFFACLISAFMYNFTMHKMTEKKCCTCLEIKSVDEFYHKKLKRPDSLSIPYSSSCKSCIKKYNQEWKLNNPEKSKSYYINKKDHYIKTTRDWMANNPDKNKRNRANHQKRPVAKIRKNIRRRINDLIKDFKQTSCHLEYTGKELRCHLQSLWTEGMNWDNYGTFWVVDHIKPVCSFNLLDPDEVRKINALLNLRPLTWKENSDKVKEDIKQRFTYSPEQEEKLRRHAEQTEREYNTE